MIGFLYLCLTIGLLLGFCACSGEETFDVPSLSDVPFNLICRTDTIKEYIDKIGEMMIVEVDQLKQLIDSYEEG